MHKWCLLYLISLHASLFSAGPMVHLWVAERFCQMRNITENSVLEGVIVGSEFPDIRYITHAPRERTHLPVMDISEIDQSATPFEAGMKLHAWLDLVRESFIDEKVYAAIAPHAEGRCATLLKFVEEEILADFYDGRNWSPYFDKILPEEVFFAQEEDVRKWHAMVQWTMWMRPSWFLWAQSYRDSAFGVSALTLYKWSYLLPELKQMPIFRAHLYALLEHIETQLKK